MLSFSKYKPQIFNELIHIDEAGAWDLECLAQELGKVIVLHGLEGFIGMSRNHKHFDLKEGEQVVSRVASDLKSFKLTVEKEDPSRIPYMWSLNADFEWTPLQFVEFNSVIYERAAKVFSSFDFLKNMESSLVQNQCRKELGIVLDIHDLIQLDLEKEYLIESTHEEKRWQVMFPRSVEEEIQKRAITTHWYFVNYGPKQCRCRCAYRCDREREGNHTNVHYEPAYC